MRQFIEFVICQNPQFNGDITQLSLEEISSVTCDITQHYNEFSAEHSDELTDSKYQQADFDSDDEHNYHDELADQVLPLKGALVLQYSKISGDEDCSEKPMLPPEKKVTSLVMQEKVSTGSASSPSKTAKVANVPSTTIQADDPDYLQQQKRCNKMQSDF